MIDAKKIEKYKNLFLEAPGITEVEYTKEQAVARNSVLSKYSRQWTRYKI